ncbi:MAG: antibiotic biosynthesis monooxygenase family protein [Brevundimonas sp.]
MTEADSEPVVLINVYRCQPGRLDELMELLSVSVRAQCDAEGFISATLHRGLDGKVAAVHGVWRSREDWKAMTRSPAVNAAMEPIMAIATFEPHLYEAGEVITP